MRLAIYSLINGLVVGLTYAAIKHGWSPGPILLLAGAVSFMLGSWRGAGALYDHLEREHHGISND